MFAFLLVTLIPAALLFAGIPMVMMSLMLETCAARTNRSNDNDPEAQPLSLEDFEGPCSIQFS